MTFMRSFLHPHHQAWLHPLSTQCTTTLTDGFWKVTLWSDFILELERLCSFLLEPRTDRSTLTLWLVNESLKWLSRMEVRRLSRMIGDGRMILALRLTALLVARSSNFLPNPQVTESQARHPLCTRSLVDFSNRRSSRTSWVSQDFVHPIWRSGLSGFRRWRCTHDFDYHRRWNN